MRPVDAEGYAAGFENGMIPGRLRDLRHFLEGRLIGAAALVERLMIALLSGGHVLIEGAPGLAKSRAVKTLASGLQCSFARVQCTPDLMPADVTGTSVWRPGPGTFEFLPGPVFHSLVLVDEINRAPPKVQSALLEAMAEGQVTSSGVTRALPHPFMVVATQNPIEHEGTFPLPEAQLDRFMLKIELSLPDSETERRILDLVEDEAAANADEEAFEPIGPSGLAGAKKAAMAVYLSPAVKDYIVRLVTAARRPDLFPGLTAKIEHPASPRGTLALAAAVKAKAYLEGRDHAVPEDAASLAADVLAHRTILTWRALADGHRARDVIGECLAQIHPV